MKKQNNTDIKVHKNASWNQRGSALIMVTVGIVAMFAFAVLAIDGAILMTTKNQLQSAADAAALAGASGLLVGSQADAVDRAVEFAAYNDAYQSTRSSVVITAADVSFPQPDIIRVRTHRTDATGDGLQTFFLRVIDQLHDGTSDMTAVAAAQGYDVCGARCLKPWAIPDRWNDANSDGVWDAGDSYDPAGTGYNAPTDVGTQIVLKSGNPQQSIEPGIFYPIDFPPINDPSGEAPLTGGKWYENWIAGCAPWIIEPGDELQLEPGNMVGPTQHGMEDLIAMDPNAKWDPVSKNVIDSEFGQSPRVGLIPFFDPTLPPTSGRNSVMVSKIGAFFIESVGPGSQVNGRFIQITTTGSPCPPGGGNGIGGSFVKGLSLVE